MGVLTTSGNLYSSGAAEFMIDGVASNSLVLLMENVKDVWAGSRSLVILTEDNKWFIQGTNRYFPGNLAEIVRPPRDVTASMVYPETETIKKVSVSSHAIGVVFESGKYAMTGSNTRGGQANGGTTRVTELTMHTDFTNVADLQLEFRDGDTSYILLDDGSIYGAGSSANGELGSITASIPNWTSLVTEAMKPNVRGIKSGSYSLFTTVETATGYEIYARGYQTQGSIGTGQNTSTSVLVNTLVATIPSKEGGQPEIFVGQYCARYQRKDTLAIFYTGINSPAIGGGVSFNGVKYVFSQMPSTVPWGTYTGDIGSVASWVVVDKRVYVAGSANASGAWAFFEVPKDITYRDYILADTSYLA